VVLGPFYLALTLSDFELFCIYTQRFAAIWPSTSTRSTHSPISKHPPPTPLQLHLPPQQPPHPLQRIHAPLLRQLMPPKHRPKNMRHPGIKIQPRLNTLTPQDPLINKRLIPITSIPQNCKWCLGNPPCPVRQLNTANSSSRSSACNASSNIFFAPRLSTGASIHRGSLRLRYRSLNASGTTLGGRH
jgi:hypothetical protein